jgi:hypothetical protein
MDVILDIVVVNAMVRNPLPGDTVVMTGAAGTAKGTVTPEEIT